MFRVEHEYVSGGTRVNPQNGGLGTDLTEEAGYLNISIFLCERRNTDLILLNSLTLLQPPPPPVHVRALTHKIIYHVPKLMVAHQ